MPDTERGASLLPTLNVGGSTAPIGSNNKAGPDSGNDSGDCGEGEGSNPNGAPLDGSSGVLVWLRTHVDFPASLSQPLVVSLNLRAFIL